MLETLVRWGVPAVLLTSAVACCFSGKPQTGALLPATATLRPTFTSIPPTAVPTGTPTSTQTPTAAFTLAPPTATPTLAATDTLVPPTDTAMPPTPEATLTPSPEPTDTPAPTPDATASRIEYVLAGTERKLNCVEVAVYGTVLDANNNALSGVTVEAVGIHGTQGRHVGTVGQGGSYAIPLARFSDLPHSEWYVAVVDDDEEVSERFHWTATAACQSNDSGDSQVLWVHWKLIE